MELNKGLAAFVKEGSGFYLGEQLLTLVGATAFWIFS
jgi:hypothetical protein